MGKPRHARTRGAVHGQARFGGARREDEALQELLLRVNCNDRRSARHAREAADLERTEVLQRARTLTAVTLLGGVL